LVVLLEVRDIIAVIVVVGTFTAPVLLAKAGKVLKRGW
jgi:hypothetical protein